MLKEIRYADLVSKQNEVIYVQLKLQGAADHPIYIICSYETPMTPTMIIKECVNATPDAVSLKSELSCVQISPL